MSRGVDRAGPSPGGSTPNAGWIVLLLILVLWSIFQDWDCEHVLSENRPTPKEQKEEPVRGEGLPVALESSQ